MSWALKGLAGPLKNKVFPIKDALTLGRQGELVVPDIKSSAIHCRIIADGPERWVLEDNSSKNGTRVDGERIATVNLTVGLKFFIGEQGFEVIETKEKAKSAAPPPVDEDETLPPPEPEVLPEVPPEPEPPPPKVSRYWHEILAEFLAVNQESFGERKRPVSPLTPVLVLEFVRGLQINSRWVLGYGPRKVGPSMLDLPIWEPGAPAVCFEIVPTTDGILFKTNHPSLVRMNGEEVDSRVLRVGDTIQINETIIEVDFNP
jgi:FHA domain